MFAFDTAWNNHHSSDLKMRATVKITIWLELIYDTEERQASRDIY